MLFKVFFLTKWKSISLTETKSLLTRKLSIKELITRSSRLMMFSLWTCLSAAAKVKPKKLTWDAQFSKELWTDHTTLNKSKAELSWLPFSRPILLFASPSALSKISSKPDSVSSNVLSMNFWFLIPYLLRKLERS